MSKISVYFLFAIFLCVGLTNFSSCTKDENEKAITNTEQKAQIPRARWGYWAALLNVDLNTVVNVTATTGRFKCKEHTERHPDGTYIHDRTIECKWPFHKICVVKVYTNGHAHVSKTAGGGQEYQMGIALNENSIFLAIDTENCSDSNLFMNESINIEEVPIVNFSDVDNSYLGKTVFIPSGDYPVYEQYGIRYIEITRKDLRVEDYTLDD